MEFTRFSRCADGEGICYAVLMRNGEGYRAVVMPATWFVAVVIVCFATSCVARSVGSTGAGAEVGGVRGRSESRVVEVAMELVRGVEVGRTRYQHRPTEVVWPSEATADRPAVCYADCSGLINAVLKRAYGLEEAELERWMGRNRPLAATYASVIADGRGFVVVTRAPDLLAGDIIAIDYEEGNKNTGHTMIVASAAFEMAADSVPMVQGTRQWAVPIIDSTGSPHGKDDTRLVRGADGKTEPVTGLGMGTLRVYTDSAGVIVGHTWGPGSKSKYWPTEDREVRVGRVDEAELARVTAKEGR